MVGGGSVLLGDELPGASELIKPEHFAVANAIGAAIGQIGGEVDRVFALDAVTRAEALETARTRGDRPRDRGRRRTRQRCAS